MTTRIKSTHPESQGPYVDIEDSQYDPKVHELYETKAAETGGQKFDREAAFAYLAEKGVKVSPKLGDVKLAALVEETKAAETGGQG